MDSGGLTPPCASAPGGQRSDFQNAIKAGEGVQEPLRVLLLGRPNAGKSSLFNQLTGASAHVGNFPGITVDIGEGTARLPHGGMVIVLDLPGLYSLSTHVEEGTDEHVAREFLELQKRAGNRFVIVHVIDATQLELGLRLTKSIQENVKGAPLLVVASQADELAREGKTLDVPALETLLEVPALCVSARESMCKDQILSAIERIGAPLYLESASNKNNSVTHGVSIPSARPLAWAPHDVATRVIHICDEPKAKRFAARARTERIDEVLLHPLWGPLLFLLIMGSLFASVFLIADPVTRLCDNLVEGFGGLLRPHLGKGLFASFVVDGMMGGAGTVAAFLPQILILIAGLDLLESSGYLSRGAFLLDRVFRAFGLGGKAFVPLLTGHACAVPAIAATRVLRDPRERLTTILVLPLMTCSARLPVYSLLITAFFGGGAFRKALVCTAIYVTGILSSLLVATLLRRTMTKGRGLPLVLEMPVYRKPLGRALAARCFQEGKNFLKSVGTVILAASVAIWVLLNVPVRPAQAHEAGLPVVERSVAAALGKSLEPLTRPLGFDWRINVGLIASLGQRELMVGTLGVIFDVEGAEENPSPLAEKIATAKRPDGTRLYSLATAVSLLVFFIFACQCVSTLSAIHRETRSWKMPAFVFVYTYVLAYVLSAFAYWVTKSLTA